MTSTRPYRSALGHDAAVAELRRVAGTQLNPIVVEAFIRQIETGASGVAHEHGEVEHAHVRDRAVEAIRLSMN
jgi:HD-GYP domain-containing protein (c-di-GMP phosphodiesterase class II)